MSHISDPTTAWNGLFAMHPTTELTDFLYYTFFMKYLDFSLS